MMKTMTVKKKLLILTTSFPNTENPSAGTFVSSFSRAVSAFFDVTVLAPSSRCSRLICPEEVHQVHAFRYAPNQFEVLAQRGGGIPSALKANRLYVFLIPLFLGGYFFGVCKRIFRTDYVQANWIVSGLMAVLPCLLMGKRLIVTLHGEDARKVAAKCSEYYILRFLVYAGCQIVVVGEEMAESLSEVIPELSDQCHMIANGVSDDLWCQSVFLRDTSNPLRMLIVASLAPIKSVDHAIQALSEVVVTGVKVRLRIVGDGPEMGELKRLVESKGLSGCVDFSGAIPQVELFSLYSKSDVLLVCSKAEGRSSVVMEAMAAGVIVAATDVEGVRELIAPVDKVNTFSYGDISGLSRVIHRLALSSSLNDSKYEVRRYAEKVFPHWQQTAKAYHQLFRQD